LPLFRFERDLSVDRRVGHLGPEGIIQLDEETIEVVRIGHALLVGRVQVDQPEHALALPNRRADDTRGVNFALTVPTSQLAVAHHIPGKHGFAFAQDHRGQERRHAVVRQLGVGARCNHIEIGRGGFVTLSGEVGLASLGSQAALSRALDGVRVF